MIKTSQQEKLKALYARLSVDDALDGDSNSILTQKRILEKYAKDNGWTNYRFYIDDGVSGTTFNRAGFQEMLADIEAGHIDTVIVKDMSRFGRDYLQVGMYTEVLFPEKDIRFIAINDQVDSAKGENDFTPLRNLFNEWYARDTSKKIRAALKAKGMSGKPLNAHGPYGYLKGENGHFIVDEETAPVVKEIFALCLAGNGPAQIARILTEREIPTPSTVTFRRTGKPPRGYYPDLPCSWLTETVIGILERKDYLGHTVNFKQTIKSYKSKKRINNSEDKQVVFENTHEAIIDADTFERVQEIRRNKRRQTKAGEKGLFSGLLFCADCGAHLNQHRVDAPGKKQDNYICSAYRKRTSNCTAHYIRTSILQQLVTEDLRRVTQYAAEHEQQFVSMMVDNSLKEHRREMTDAQRTLETQKARMTELDNIIKRLYEDTITGKLSDERFTKLSSDYEDEQRSLQSSTAKLAARLTQDQDKVVNINKFLDIVKRHLSFEKLTGTILNAFIEKIIVHAPDKSTGERIQKIEIFYNFVGKIEIPDTQEQAREPVRFQARTDAPEREQRESA